MTWRAVKRRLIQQADNYQQNLILLISGFGLCMLGILLITIAEFLFGQSLQQELIALLGMAFVAIGVLLALTGYISLSILRIFRILISDNPKSKDET
jgi:hypothetical protein